MPEPAVATPTRPTPRRKFRWWFVLTIGIGGALLIAGAAKFYQLYWWQLKPGAGPAGPNVPAQLFADVWTQQEVMLLGIGDSVTAGFGASPGRSYFERLERNPANEFADMQGRCLSAVLPNLQVRNLSVSSTTSLHHIKTVRKLEPFDDETLGLIVMTTGGNDVLHNYGHGKPQEGAMYGASLDQAQPWIDNFEQRLNDMLDHLTAVFPAGCHIFVANIYDPTDGVGKAAHFGFPDWPDGMQILAGYNDVIARVAQQRDNVHFVNIHDPMLGHGIYCRQFWRTHYRRDDPHYWYHGNFEDPNDRGYDAIRRLFLSEIARVLSPQSAALASAEKDATNTARPAAWAQPIDKPGLPNLHRITDTIYRGAQPDDDGFAQLKDMGIKTVINLRTMHSDRNQCQQHGLDYVHITVQAWEGEDDEVIDFLKVVGDPSRHPVFFHCQHGADRTGMMAAVYRIAVQGWPKRDAIREMTEGGYGYHTMWQNLIDYLQELDVEQMAEQAGLRDAPAVPIGD